MKFKSTIIVIFISLITITTVFLINNQDTFLKQKTYNNTQTKHTGYLNGDLQCNANCRAKDGISCGTAWQNCCRPSYCFQKWYGSEICEDGGRIEIPGCTEKLI